MRFSVLSTIGGCVLVILIFGMMGVRSTALLVAVLALMGLLVAIGMVPFVISAYRGTDAAPQKSDEAQIHAGAAGASGTIPRRLVVVLSLSVIDLALLGVFIVLGGEPWWLGTVVLWYSIAGVVALAVMRKRALPKQRQQQGQTNVSP